MKNILKNTSVKLRISDVLPVVISTVDFGFVVVVLIVGEVSSIP